MSVLAYHPGTGHRVVVDDGALDHMRTAGWLSWAEHEANEAEARERAAQAEAAQDKAAQAGGKSAKTEK